MSVVKQARCQARGAVLVIALIFIVLFSALAVALAGLSGANVQVASNQHRLNAALHAAQSGLECAKYLVTTATPGQTYTNCITAAQANQAWTALCTHIRTTALDGQTAGPAARFTDGLGCGDVLLLSAMDFRDGGSQFVVEFFRYDSDPRTVRVKSTGTSSTHGAAQRYRPST